MDLTDKIDSHNFIPIEWINSDGYYYGIRKCLTEITPKIAIDFAKYCSSWDWCLVKEGYWMNPDYPSKTSEQLFEEFLKDYKYEW